MGQEYIKDIVVRSQAPFSTEPWLYDDFESILNWSITDNSNASAAVTRITTDAYQGVACMQIDTGATAPADNDEIRVMRGAILGPNKYLEMVTFYRTSLNGGNALVRFEYTVGQNGQAWQFNIQIDTQNDTFTYLDEQQNYTNITTPPVSTATGGWNTLRIAVDPYNGQYLYVIHNGSRYGLNNAQAPTFGETTGTFVEIGLYLVTLTAARATCRFDNVIVRSVDKV